MPSPGVYHYYPSGFRVALQDDYRPEVVADCDVEDLWREFQAKEGILLQWDFHKRVIKAAKRLFGNYPTWVADQSDNQQLSLAQKRFTQDSTNFILRGRREIHIESHVMLIAMEKQTGKNQKFKSPIVEELSYRDTDLICQWTKQPHGIEDLLRSMKIFFGTEI
jgi:hypothetical protein